MLNQDVHSQEILSNKIQTVERTNKQLNDKTDKNFQAINADLQFLQNEIEQMPVCFSNEEKNREVNSFKKELQASLQNFQQTLWQERRTFASSLEKPIELIITETREKLRASWKERSNLDMEQVHDFGWLIQQLNSELVAISQDRKECAKMLESALLLEFQKLRSSFTRAKEDREETNDAMSKMMEEMHVQARNDLALSKKQRIAAGEAVLQVLEDICNEIEHTVYPEHTSQDNLLNSTKSFEES